MSKDRITPRFKVWLELDGRRIMGEEEAQILEGIHKLGSFIATAKALGVSYAHAWNTVDRIREAIGATVVEASKGGRYGGGAKITEAGLELLKRYHEFEEQMGASLSGTSPTQTRQVVFSPRSELPDFTVIGSDCVGIQALLDMMLKEKSFSCEVVKAGSSGGLAAIMLGEADVAGIHLFDEETELYNTPFLKRYWIADKAVLIRGYLRDIGLILARGNPKKIRGVSDLLRSGVKFVNRPLGSGTRTILDIYLKREFEKRGFKFKDVAAKVKGYSVEVKSHSEVAEAVLKDEADVGLGLKAAAHTYRLDFIPITQENFDFVVEEERLKKPLVKMFIEELGSNEFKAKVKDLGLHVTRETGNIIYRP